MQGLSSDSGESGCFVDILVIQAARFCSRAYLGTYWQGNIPICWSGHHLRICHAADMLTYIQPGRLGMH